MSTEDAILVFFTWELPLGSKHVCTRVVDADDEDSFLPSLGKFQVVVG